MKIARLRQIVRFSGTWGHLLVVLVLGSNPAIARGQISPAAGQDSAANGRRTSDSLSGRWESRSRNAAYGGNLYLRLTLNQKGDSLAGSMVMEYKDQASEAPTDFTGSVHDGKFDVIGRFGAFRLTGSLRNGKLETRVVPGRAAESSAFSATFVRLP